MAGNLGALTALKVEAGDLDPELGVLELQCQVLTDPAQGHTLLVCTATPGTSSHSNLALLAVDGNQPLNHG